jgi:hypothetical protein
MAGCHWSTFNLDFSDDNRIYSYGNECSIHVVFLSINALSFWLKKSFTGMNMQVIAVEIAKEMWIKTCKKCLRAL